MDSSLKVPRLTISEPSFRGLNSTPLQRDQSRSLSPVSSSEIDRSATRTLNTLANTASERCLRQEQILGDLEKRVKEELGRSKEHLKNIKEINERLQQHSQTINRATNVWVPDISRQIVETRKLSEVVRAKLPKIKEEVADTAIRYDHGRRKASKLENQLQWIASRWHVKLWKVLTFQVEYKRRKLFTIIAPVAIVFVVLILVLLIAWFIIWHYLF